MIGRIDLEPSHNPIWHDVRPGDRGTDVVFYLEVKGLGVLAVRTASLGADLKGKLELLGGWIEDPPEG